MTALAQNTLIETPQNTPSVKAKSHTPSSPLTHDEDHASFSEEINQQKLPEKKPGEEKAKPVKEELSVQSTVKKKSTQKIPLISATGQKEKSPEKSLSKTPTPNTAKTPALALNKNTPSSLDQNALGENNSKKTGDVTQPQLSTNMPIAEANPLTPSEENPEDTIQLQAITHQHIQPLEKPKKLSASLKDTSHLEVRTKKEHTPHTEKQEVPATKAVPADSLEEAPQTKPVRLTAHMSQLSKAVKPQHFKNIDRMPTPQISAEAITTAPLKTEIQELRPAQTFDTIILPKSQPHSSQGPQPIQFSFGHTTNERGDQHLKINLRPDELGHIRVDLKVDGTTGEKMVNLVFALPQTYELFKENTQSLQQMLMRAGYDLSPDQINLQHPNEDLHENLENFFAQHQQEHPRKGRQNHIIGEELELEEDEIEMTHLNRLVNINA